MPPQTSWLQRDDGGKSDRSGLQTLLLLIKRPKRHLRIRKAARSPMQRSLIFSFFFADIIMPSFSPAALWPILLLSLSNVFMTFAWYGHLKYKNSALFMAILVSWGIAFFEYCLAVPANRIGSQVYSAAQLKTMQEVITLIVFAGFSVFWLKEALTINHVIGFILIAAGAAFVFKG
jgi:uncharacterized protein (DUF486 family)